MNKIIYLLLISFLSIHVVIHSQAQTPGPPSLAIGAGKVLYDKGSLDAELISTIIATKQDEIKNELASRLILEKLSNESYVIQHFAKTNIDLLFKEKNLTVIKKELLRNASELMITSATLEFYLRVHRKKNDNDPFTNIIGDVIKSFNDIVEVPITPKATEKGLFRGFRDHRHLKKLYEKVSIPYRSRYAFIGKYFQKQDIGYYDTSVRKAISTKTFLFNESIPARGKFLPKPNYLFGFDKLRFMKIGDKELYLQNILLDLTYGVLVKNEFIQQLGLFSNVQNGEERNALDNYIFFCNSVNPSAKNDLKVNLLNNLKRLESCMTSDLTFLTKYQFILSQINSSALKLPSNVVDSVFLNESIGKIIDELKLNLMDQKLNETLCKDCDKSVFHSLLALTNSEIKNSSRNDDDWLYTLQVKLLPVLMDFSLTNNSRQASLIKTLGNLQDNLRQRLVSNLLKDWKNLPSRKQGSDILFSQEDLKATLLKLVSMTVNNFDQAETYDVVMNFISGLGKIASNPVAKKVAAKIIDAGEKYIVVQKDSNKVSLDVESMAVDLYKQFSENSSQRFGMYFSVGINYNAPLGSGIKINDTTSVKSYAFLSEKIGLKYTIFDFGRRYGYFKMTRKPVIKDVHSILFGSGLLYQIKELSTAKNFSSPIVGLGVGASFFNDLDFNINYAFPIDRDISRSLLNVSFDIKITEYLAALSKSKKQNKN